MICMIEKKNIPINFEDWIKVCGKDEDVNDLDNKLRKN